MRLFVAVDIDDGTRAQIASVRDAVRGVVEHARVAPRIAWVKDDQAHVTLRFIGEQNEERGAAIQTALSREFETKPFDVHWDRVGTFGGRQPRVIWIGASSGSEELNALAAEVDERLGPLIGPGESRRFNAHVTLGRIKESGREVDWGAALAAARFRPTVTHVDRVTLYVSRLSSAGPTYTSLCRAQLR